MADWPIIRFRADPRTKRLLDRLRSEKAIDRSEWLRQLVDRELEKVFPDVADPQKAPIETEAAPKRDPQKTLIETGAAPKPDPQKTPPETEAAPKPDPQKTLIETEATTGHQAVRERDPWDTPEATTGQQAVQEPDPPQKTTPIQGWKPYRLTPDTWGAVLEGSTVAELPDNDHLVGIPIRVTDKRDEPWLTTITAVVKRTSTTIVVRTAGRPSR